jgi:hypothetical protein
MHADDETLALIALGEPPRPEDAAHVAACERCTQELSSLAAAVGTARSLTAEDTLVPPAPEVWQRISDELGLGAADRSASVDDPAGPDRSAADGSTSDDDVPAPVAGVAPVVTLRRRSLPWIAAAAAAGVVVGGAGGAWLVGRETDEAPEVVAEATLDPLPGWEASGEAVVEVADDGARTLVLELAGEPDGGGFAEVWLIDRDVTRLVSLGVLEGSEGRFTVPSGLDLSDFVVVDVSQEPYDGDPAHSGDSIIRGLLDT